jgi:flagellar capping protein FliD
MIVYLEQCKISESQLAAYEKGNAELQLQIETLKNTIKAMDELVKLQKEKEDTYKNLLEMERTMAKAKDKACQEQIEAAEPTFLQEVGKYSTGGIIGAIIVGIIILL